jgi:TRAP-type C4-dicarboxylate transport system substrate-binding protein
MNASAKGNFHYVCAHDMRVENPLHIRLTQVFEAVRDETQGRLEVEIIPWGGAGPSKVSLGKLLNDEIAFHPVSGMPLSTIVPVAAMEGLPFAYRSEEEACRIFDGAFGDLLRKEIAAKGLVVFPMIWPQGFNQITSSTTPIRTVHDLNGFKLRIAQVPYKLDLFRSLGCDPQQIYYQAVYDNLKSGAASGQETPYLYVEMDKFVEVQKYLSATYHRLGSFWMCANPESWKALPADVRESVERNLKKHVALFREDMVRLNAQAAERLKTRLEFNQADTSTFVERLKQNGFYARWRKEFGEKAWALLEAQRGPLP